MPSPLPPESSPGRPTTRAVLDELISQARRLRGGVAAVPRDAGGAGGQETPRGRWERALCDLTAAELDEVGGRLRELRAGTGGPRAGGEPLTGSAEWNLLTDEVVWSADLFGLFGRDAADGPLSLDELSSWVHAEDQPALTAAVTDTLVDSRRLDVEFRVVRPDGTVRSLHMAGEPELDAEGDTACLWAVLRDVTELRRGEQAVRDSRESLRTAELPAGGGYGLAAGMREAVLPRWRRESRGGAAGPAPEGLETASRYLPSERSTLLGGAWFDVLALPDGGTLLTVGELTGHGVAAVSGMTMLLGAVRGMALAGVAPGALMGHLDELLDSTALPAPGSAVCGVYEPGGKLLTWSQTGSCVPLVFRRGTGRRLRPPTDVPLGAAARHGHAQHRVRLEAGDVLVLHTDGQAASGHDGRRSSGHDPQAPDRLLRLGPRLGAAGTAQECLRAVVEECPDDGRAEDAAVLVARVSP